MRSGDQEKIGVEKCREYLGDTFSDAEIEGLRDTLYTLCERVVDQLISSKI